MLSLNFRGEILLFNPTLQVKTTFGYINCRSKSLFERDTICRDSEYCCGTYQNKCCSTSPESVGDSSEAVALILTLLVFIGCPLWCCWCCCCRKTKTPGAVYNPVAAVPPTSGRSQLPSQGPAEVPSALKTPYPLQPNLCAQQTPYPGQQPPYPGQQPPYPGQQPPYPGQQLPYPGQQLPYPVHQPPYPGQQIPYPAQPMPYPQPYSSNVTPYPPQQPPYPPQQTPYPPNTAPYPPNTAPYPPNTAPFPNQSAQQTLSPSGLETLYPPQEATNPYFKMPPPAYNETLQHTAPPQEPGHVETGVHQPPSAPPP